MALVFNELCEDFMKLRVRKITIAIQVNLRNNTPKDFCYTPKKTKTKTPTTKHHYRDFQTPKFCNIRLRAELPTYFS